jgi:nitrite reductase (NADH) small subunit
MSATATLVADPSIDSAAIADQWVKICSRSMLSLDRGVCAMVGGEPVAVFAVSPSGALFAVSNIDPFSGASVISRGLVGSKGDVAKVASPMYKHSFDLATGVCLDDSTVRIATFQVRVVDDIVYVARRPLTR